MDHRQGSKACGEVGSGSGVRGGEAAFGTSKELRGLQHHVGHSLGSCLHATHRAPWCGQWGPTADTLTRTHKSKQRIHAYTHVRLHMQDAAKFLSARGSYVCHKHSSLLFSGSVGQSV